MLIFFYILTGISAGFLSGLLGIGGGIITSPSLILILQQQPLFRDANLIHIAASTSLVIMAMTATSSAYAYHRRQAVIFPIFWRMVPGLSLGLASGALLSHVLSSQVLIYLFACFLIGVAIYLFFNAKRSLVGPSAPQRSTRHDFSAKQYWLLLGGSFAVGNLSTLFGVGGGILMVPLFLILRCSIQEAAGTATLCSIVSAFVGTFLLAYLPQPISTKLPHTFGNIYWPAVLCIGIASAICAPYGTRLAFYLKPSLLKQLFSGVLLIAAWSLLRS